MKYRWTLYYDGACPLCSKAKIKIEKLLEHKVKLTVVDLNSSIARAKGYNGCEVVLEDNSTVYYGIKAWIKILSDTKYKWSTHILFRPFLILVYYFVGKNRKFLSKFT